MLLQRCYNILVNALILQSPYMQNSICLNFFAYFYYGNLYISIGTPSLQKPNLILHSSSSDVPWALEYPNQNQVYLQNKFID